jgi:putative PIN family toxin of toxin-antitoxin system
LQRVVIDPGVLVSAAIGGSSPPARLWRAIVEGALEVVICPHLIAELAGVLERPKFRAYLTETEALAYVSEIARLARALPDPVDPPARTRDAGDNYLLALASAAGVAALISGDRDLTDLIGNDPPIVTPAQAVEQLL